MNALAALFLREWRVARRIGGGASVGAVFFLILVAIMPFALGPDLRLLARLGPAILWIAALLSTLLGLDRLFQADAEDGSLDLMTHATPPLELVVLVKCAAHWTTSILPLAVAAPLFGLMLAMDGLSLGLVTLTLVAGTPGLDDDRRHRRGAYGLAAARRSADGGAGAAAVDPRADLRRFGRLGGVRRARAASRRRSPCSSPCPCSASPPRLSRPRRRSGWCGSEGFSRGVEHADRSVTSGPGYPYEDAYGYSLRVRVWRDATSMSIWHDLRRGEDARTSAPRESGPA